MKPIVHRTAVAALAIACSLPTFAQTTGGGTGSGTTGTGTSTQATNNNQREEGGFDLGWLGLLGLIGLAGLKRRDDRYENRTMGTTTGR